MDKLNLFYEEPNPDRWIKFDRYPRQLIRRIVRGKTRPGGVMMVALSLMKGLDTLGIPYRFNDYAYAKKNPNELIGVIGKPHLIFEKRFKNPILFGAGVFSHPVDCPDLFTLYPNLKKILVPGPWMRTMCLPYYGDQVEYWPVGIETEKWSPAIKGDEPKIDFLIYDKIRWDHELYEESLINSIIQQLSLQNLSCTLIRYGHYQPADLSAQLGMAKAVIFLCEHETQGIAYQQILATGTPILAWDRGGFWKDPHYYPRKVKYEPVSSVPYWNEKCGLKFKDEKDFPQVLEDFLLKLDQKDFDPRAYILENLTLEISAKKYVNIYQSLR